MNEPAFPCEKYMSPEKYDKLTGMDLRDYFASAAVSTASMIVGPDIEAIAEWSYKYSDTMMKLRNK